MAGRFRCQRRSLLFARTRPPTEGEVAGERCAASNRQVAAAQQQNGGCKSTPRNYWQAAWRCRRLRGTAATAMHVLIQMDNRVGVIRLREQDGRSPQCSSVSTCARSLDMVAGSQHHSFCRVPAGEPERWSGFLVTESQYSGVGAAPSGIRSDPVTLSPQRGGFVRHPPQCAGSTLRQLAGRVLICRYRRFHSRLGRGPRLRISTFRLVGQVPATCSPTESAVVGASGTPLAGGGGGHLGFRLFSTQWWKNHSVSRSGSTFWRGPTASDIPWFKSASCHWSLGISPATLCGSGIFSGGVRSSPQFMATDLSAALRQRLDTVGSLVSWTGGQSSSPKDHRHLEVPDKPVPSGEGIPHHCRSSVGAVVDVAAVGGSCRRSTPIGMPPYEGLVSPTPSSSAARGHMGCGARARAAVDLASTGAAFRWAPDLEADDAVGIGGREADSGALKLVRHRVHPPIEWRHIHRWRANEDAADGLPFETRHSPLFSRSTPVPSWILGGLSLY